MEQKPDLTLLTASQLKIYKSVLAHFPDTDPWTAWDVAINDGIKFQAVNR